MGRLNPVGWTSESVKWGSHPNALRLILGPTWLSTVAIGRVILRKTGLAEFTDMVRRVAPQESFITACTHVPPVHDAIIQGKKDG
jgi:hypothetical protein